MMEDYFRGNFGMIVPLEPMSMEIKADPNGVPIYAKCPAGDDMCACTGACRKILGYDTDPDKVKAYHEGIERRNNLLKERISYFRGTITKMYDDGKTRIWSWEIIQPNAKK